MRETDPGLGFIVHQPNGGVGHQIGACRAHGRHAAVVLARGGIRTDGDGQRCLEYLPVRIADGGDGVVAAAVAVGQ